MEVFDGVGTLPLIVFVRKEVAGEFSEGEEISIQCSATERTDAEGNPVLQNGEQVYNFLYGW